MKKLKYNAFFESLIRPLVSAEKDKYLALASLEQVKKHIPEVDTETNIDLLPIAFNAAVINRINKNGDVIDTETAVALYKTFINKPINVEHDRKKVIGVILSAGFTAFGTDAPLTLDQVKEMKGPFNITLGGVIWRIVNPGVANVVEETNDPTSENYEAISASWELGFNEFEVVLMEGDSKNLEDGSVIKDAAQIEAYKDNLKAYGGEGKAGDKYVYRKPAKKDTIAVGIGLTESPAAEVKGIATADEEITEITADNSKLISQPAEAAVKDNSIIYNSMKITAISDITDENLKVMKASAISEFIQDQLKEADKKFQTEQGEKQKLAEAHKLTAAELEKVKQDAETAKTDLKKVQDALAELQRVNTEREKQELFTARMSAFDAAYELNDDDRKVIGSQIKDMAVELFAAYEKQLAVLMKEKNKEFIKKQKEIAAASTTPVTAVTPGTTVETAIENATPKNPAVPSTTTTTQTLQEKYAKAFAPENFLIKP
jgi:hypothetical protein